MNKKSLPKILSLLVLFSTLVFANEQQSSQSIFIKGRFQCGRGSLDNKILLNCENAYLHGINFEGNPHIHATVDINNDGHFNLEIPLNKEMKEKNEMSFILRSKDEDRVLGIFYVNSGEANVDFTESFFINIDQDFGDLTISRKREILVPIANIKNLSP
jgi:hypothetical protein